MDLHQIQVTYQQDDDRVLVQATFNQREGNPLEFRVWFTRRFVKVLWQGIIATLQGQVMLDQPQAAHASVEIVNMENQAALNEIKTQGNFDTPFKPLEYLYPLGQLPIVISNVQFTLDADMPVRIHFTDSLKNGVELTFTPALLHGFCSLLQQAVKAAEWGIDLQLPGTHPNDEMPRVLN